VNYKRLACYEHCPGTFGYTFVENLLKTILNFRLIPVQTKCNAENWANILLFFEQLTNVKVQITWSSSSAATITHGMIIENCTFTVNF